MGNFVRQLFRLEIFIIWQQKRNSTAGVEILKMGNFLKTIELKPYLSLHNRSLNKGQTLR